MKKIYLVFFIFLTLLALVIGVFIIWASSSRGPQREAIEALQSNDLVDVQIDNWIIFRPKSKECKTGLILYPGARVDIRSYSPAARAITLKGFLVVIVPMPLNLASFGINRASEVIDAFPHIVHWVIGGHSLGGAMAASFVASNPSIIEGLVLWSSHPASDNDLSDRNLLAVSIYETLNGLSINKKIDGTRHLLPSRTSWIPVEGGTHAQFGWYGPQKGENVATISQKDQQKIIIDATLDLLKHLGN